VSDHQANLIEQRNQSADILLNQAIIQDTVLLNQLVNSSLVD
jgi:hypothetical protein